MYPEVTQEQKYAIENRFSEPEKERAEETQRTLFHGKRDTFHGKGKETSSLFSIGLL